MGFQEPARKDQTGPAMAVQLAQALTRVNVVQRVPDVPEWSGEFSKLLAQVQVARVQRVLDWLCSNIGVPYIPRIYSARTFRLKFESVEQAMQDRLGPRADRIEPSERATVAATRLSALDWPIEVRPHLAQIVQLSYDRFQAFGASLRAQLAAAEADDRCRRFLGRVLELYIYTAWVEDEWMYAQRQRLGRSGHFYGPWASLAFDPASETFLASFWRGWASDWAGDWSVVAFDDLLKRILTCTGV